MKINTLKSLLDPKVRGVYYKDLLLLFKNLTQVDNISYFQYETLEGVIPCIYIKSNCDFKDIKFVKVFISAQHNEYSGLYGIINFLKHIADDKINLDSIINKNQDIFFFPIMNPYGFLNPRQNNKSGYFLKNKTNLNRFWRRTFAPEHHLSKNDNVEYPLPEHSKYVKKILQKYWNRDKITISILDFHESSLLEKFPNHLLENLSQESISYKFDHWLKEGIILNVMKLYKIPYYRKPLFTKCIQSIDHTHINLTNKQLELVYEKLEKYISLNSGKLPFYFCYSNKSKDFCQRLSSVVYKNLKDILWETYFPSFNHEFHDHGCFVKMSDATSRKNIYTIEVESKKHFFNIFNEYQKSKSDPKYFDKKIFSINQSIKLAYESIKEMIALF
ncbi:MAG: hypothetical protein KGD63_01770 [Candidatus Lokiarchaeota archaeon]|nr:hypothetical protein [Candidatus Lokiarchaeota archaeon]